jgi:hypothetical protein
MLNRAYAFRRGLGGSVMGKRHWLVGGVGGGGVNPETLVQWLGIKSKIKNKYRYMLILL